MSGLGPLALGGPVQDPRSMPSQTAIASERRATPSFS